MKLAIKGAFIFIIVLFLVLIVLDMSGKNVRNNETATLANNATYEAVKVLANGSYDVETMDELVGEAIKDIVMNKQSDSTIKVQVMGVDAENGLIDLNVIQTVKHVNGEVTELSERRTVILE